MYIRAAHQEGTLRKGSHQEALAILALLPPVATATALLLIIVLHLQHLDVILEADERVLLVHVWNREEGVNREGGGREQGEGMERRQARRQIRYKSKRSEGSYLDKTPHDGRDLTASH